MTKLQLEQLLSARNNELNAARSEISRLTIELEIALRTPANPIPHQSKYVVDVQGSTHTLVFPTGTEKRVAFEATKAYAIKNRVTSNFRIPA